MTRALDLFPRIVGLSFAVLLAAHVFEWSVL